MVLADIAEGKMVLSVVVCGRRRLQVGSLDRRLTHADSLLMRSRHVFLHFESVLTKKEEEEEVMGRSDVVIGTQISLVGEMW